MVTLSERSIGLAVKSGDRLGRLSPNPVRRGPVVLATDGTERGGSAVVAAQLLAAHLDLPLEVVTVLEPTPIYAVPEVVIASDPAIDEARRQARETAVADYVCRFSGGATPPRIHVRFGSVAAEISRFARDVSATMVVLGSAPHRRFRHMASGDRAAQVLHAAQCPVFSVPPSFRALPHTVVAAIDFGPASVRAAAAALLVVRDGGTLLLTHVLPPLVRPASLTGQTENDASANARTLFDHVREELDAFAPRNVKIETRIMTDDAIEGILSSATHADADLIAVGTHGSGFLSRLLLGSVAESVLHEAAQAVLASPPPPPGEALELWRRVTGVASSNREQEWRAALDGFTRRNAGRPVMLEASDPETGAHVAGSGYALMGVTYEPSAHRVEIMVGDASRPLHHLTRSVLNPEAITMRATPTGDGEVLDIRHGRGHTVAAVTHDALTHDAVTPAGA
jgi:nucleotide-binding universal stress UspA family protein